MGTGPGRNVGTCERCGGEYVFGNLASHWHTEACKFKWLERKTQTKPKTEVVMPEQKPLSYKRETLIEALKGAVAENERKRAEEKQKKLDKDKKAIDGLVELMKENPSFARNMISRAASQTNLTSDDVGGEAFKEVIRAREGRSEEEGFEFDSDLKKLIRVYEKAEDETVEVHVHDTVYNYL